MRPIAKQDVKKTKLSFFDILLAINNRAKSQCILREERASIGHEKTVTVQQCRSC